MIGSHRFDRVQFSVDDQSQEPNKRQLIFGVVDLATKQRHPGPVLLGLVDQLEGISRGTGRSSEDADHQARVVVDQFLGRPRAVVDHFQEQRASRTGNTRQRASNQVVDESRQHVRRNAVGQVRIEDLQEVPEPLPLGLVPKRPVRLDRLQIVVTIVGKSDRVESEVSTDGAFFDLAVEMSTLDVINRGRTKRL